MAANPHRSELLRDQQTAMIENWAAASLVVPFSKMNTIAVLVPSRGSVIALATGR